MRKVMVTKLEFDEFLFDDITRASAQDDNELECALRLLRKLKDPKITEERPLSARELEVEAQSGRKLWPGRRLSVPEIILDLEEDEWALVCQRLKAAVPMHSILVLDEFHVLLFKVHNAEQG